MALNYANLFEDLGEYVQRINAFRVWAADAGDIKTAYTQIVNELTANSMSHLLDDLPDLFDGYRDTITGWCDDMASLAEQRLLDRDTILEELPLGSNTTIQNVLLELIRAMVAAPQTIKDTAVLIGGSTPVTVVAAADVGTITSDGNVFVNGILDGVSAPGSGMSACRNYLGRNTELPIPETIYITCVSDADSNGLTEGEEEFEIKGAVPGNNSWDWRGAGSGDGPRFRTLNASGLLTNGDFEDWTTSTPDSWTVTTGGATIVSTPTTTAKRGTKVLKITSAGATVTLNQEVVVTPGKRYAVAFWLKSPTTPIAAGTVTVGLYGTGLLVVGTITVSAIPSSWTHYCFFLNVPFEIPADVYLQIKWDTPTATEVLEIDGVGFGPAVWHNGLCFAASPGASSVPFIIGDRFSIAITQSGTAGVFQEFFRRRYGMQLPSSATPSQSDNLATD